ncbi:hypothetical protein AAE02nite_26720 [Adhaeribacter aerolatus]|uniref:Septum formation inhibitor Maf n=1 Tax=Adhaeribacter aerolatus TaxID=670289 RepID=A0A512AZ62_9BACT|nr:hypothetical protein AAE02nite_26720 [Adhaeribacter aerolatus]
MPGLIWLLLLGLGSCTSRAEQNKLSAEQQTCFNPEWAQNKHWDDGLAEVAIYQAERVVYNKPRSFEYVLITVKEDFNQAFNVKTDNYNRSDLFPVMKVNQFCRIPTDNYPYHYLTSLFFRRENPVQVHKITSSSQEWCGNTFKAITQAGNNFNYSFNSYWDEQGTGELTLPGDLLFEDQLPYTLRSLRFKDGLTLKAPIAELLQTNKANKPAVYPATITVHSDIGSTPNLWLVSVKLSAEKENKYFFRKEYPHILEKQQTWDGRQLQLKEVTRYAYWQK